MVSIPLQDYEKARAPSRPGTVSDGAPGRVDTFMRVSYRPWLKESIPDGSTRSCATGAY